MTKNKKKPKLIVNRTTKPVQSSILKNNYIYHGTRPAEREEYHQILIDLTGPWGRKKDK